METLVDVVAQPELHSHAILHSTLCVTRVTVVDFLRSGCYGSSPSLTHLWLHNLCLRRPFRLTHSLAHSLHNTGEKKVTLSLSVHVVRPCRKAVSTEDMQTSTASTLVSLKHHSLRLLREYHFISRLTMPIMGNSEGCSKPCWRLAATSCKRLPHMKRCWIFMDCLEIFLSGPAHSVGLTQRANPNLDKTFKVNKQTTLVIPIYLSTPPPHTTVRDGRRWACRWSLVLICAVRGWLEPHHDGLSLLFKIKHVSMSLKKRFDRDQSYRFSPNNGFTKLLHLAYLHMLGDVKNCGNEVRSAK